MGAKGVQGLAGVEGDIRLDRAAFRTERDPSFFKKHDEQDTPHYRPRTAEATIRIMGLRSRGGRFLEPKPMMAHIIPTPEMTALCRASVIGKCGKPTLGIKTQFNLPTAVWISLKPEVTSRRSPVQGQRTREVLLATLSLVTGMSHRQIKYG